MYNKVILMGRITHDLELKTTPSGANVCSFSIAVDRRFQQKGEEKKSKDAKKEQSADDRILEERLAESIGAPVHVVYGKKGRGKIVIDFADLDDLDALIAKLAPEKM